MRQIGDAKGVSVARIALAWLLAKPAVMSVIIGDKMVEQLDDNLAATEVTLTTEEMKTLDDISAISPEIPRLDVRDAGKHEGAETVREGEGLPAYFITITADVPSDHFGAGTKKVVIPVASSSAWITGEPGRFAPQSAALVSGT